MTESYSAEDFAQARLTEHTLPDVQGNAARKVQKLVDHIADQDRVIRRRNDEIAALRRELADAQVPLSLDRLAAAWKEAEVPTEDNPIQEGDVVVFRHGGGFAVEPADRILSGQTHGQERVLSRAPKTREPWAELAGVLHDVVNQGGNDHIDADSAAARLYAEGVRVTGGDES